MKAKPHTDPYLAMLHKHWGPLNAMYSAFEDRGTIIEFDVVGERILAYPAQDYINQLTERTREQTRKQYREAVAEGALMVFVRDEAARVLCSYYFPPDDECADEP